MAFLKRGGGLLSVGGAAFKRPVRREGDELAGGTEQTAYHQQLLSMKCFGSSCPVSQLCGFRYFAAAEGTRIVVRCRRHMESGAAYDAQQ